MFTIKIEDPELREYLKQEGKNALVALGREEVQNVLLATIDKGCKKIVNEMDGSSWVKGVFLDKLRAELRGQLTGNLQTEVRALAEEFFKAQGGIQTYVDRYLTNLTLDMVEKNRRMILEEIHKLRSSFTLVAGAVLSSQDPHAGADFVHDVRGETPK